MENDIKKLEIVTDYAYLNRLIKLFDSNKVTGYTIFKDVMGRGKRGNKDGHGISGGFKNCYIFIFVEMDEAKRIAELIKPVLVKYGGFAAVSDAHWVVH